MMKVYVWSIR
jgi:hypothetical protein